MWSLPPGFRVCTGNWWFAATYNGCRVEKIQIIVDNGGDDWFRSTQLKSLEINQEVNHFYSQVVLIATTHSGSVYHLPLAKMGLTDQMEDIRSHSAPKAQLLGPMHMEKQVRKFLGLSEEFDLHTLTVEPKELTRDDLLELAKEVRVQLDKINTLYRDMFTKAGIDLDEVKAGQTLTPDLDHARAALRKPVRIQ